MVGSLRVAARVLRAKRLVADFIVGTWQPWRPQGNGLPNRQFLTIFNKNLLPELINIKIT
jgi:hypothetical protein